MPELAHGAVPAFVPITLDVIEAWCCATTRATAEAGDPAGCVSRRVAERRSGRLRAHSRFRSRCDPRRPRCPVVGRHFDGVLSFATSRESSAASGCSTAFPPTASPRSHTASRTSSRRQGLAAEADPLACVDWALAQPGIHAVQATTFPWHEASLGVIRRLGMAPAGAAHARRARRAARCSSDDADMRDLVALPIIQAPMAGGPNTPALAAAGVERRGLGSIGCAYLAPAQIDARSRAACASSPRSRSHSTCSCAASRSAIRPAAARDSPVLAPFRAELGLTGALSVATAGAGLRRAARRRDRGRDRR